MDIRQLEYFQMVCRVKNFTKAAESLHVAQPSVTIAIKKLEEELGVKLFDRSKKKIELTEEGLVFLEEVDDILLKINNAVVHVQDFVDQKKEVISVGIPPITGSHIFPELLTTFKNENPNIDLHIQEMGSQDVSRAIENDELDIGIVILAHSLPKLEVNVIGGDEICVFMHEKHHLSKVDYVSFGDLKDESFIMINKGISVNEIIYNECEKHNFEPNVVFKSLLPINIERLVSAGVGITFFPKSQRNTSSNIISKPLKESITIEKAIVWKKGRRLSKASKSLVEFIKSISEKDQLILENE